MSDHSTEESSVEGVLDDAHIGDLVSNHLDEIDYKIYRILNEDGRISDTDLGERVDLSRTAVRRRRKKLQEENMIKIIGVLVLQEAELSYADVRVTVSSDATRDAIDEFIAFLIDQELVYEVDEYLGQSDILVRVWHGSLQDVKTYVIQLMQRDIVEDFEITPVTKTHKAWHSEIEDD
ncbi:AsnC family transcriptional regulator [Natronorubrum sp. JWXQ-INN-674]|uniref:AsnC family transcriptional regulator n=1 Tax=Natronorubrum halalkaliphilum TaxID=2691917 RepID=A0A6B0VRA2_9EURY|nr:Lrp/AsnC family transcriptional regulator [Natronorubrum halalkaliphilum]MXV64048.1 AsnC family transcriptional regulator [Natronorubrum halalkaliphilum]